VDFRNSAKQSVDFLKHKGHERIAILTPPPSPGNIASHLRYKGYCDAMNVTGLEIDNPLYWQVPGGQSDSYYTEMIINYFTASRAKPASS
jgi:DNA-binding LacI/PurR family transcriptional regulator